MLAGGDDILNSNNDINSSSFYEDSSIAIPKRMLEQSTCEENIDRNPTFSNLNEDESRIREYKREVNHPHPCYLMQHERLKQLDSWTSEVAESKEHHSQQLNENNSSQLESEDNNNSM